MRAPAPSKEEPSNADDRARACVARYWRRNVRFMAALLFVWAAVGLGCGVLFADTLNAVRFGGFRLGFWFAQQGSILVFVLLILVYAVTMRRLDSEHHAELAELASERSDEAAEAR